ncbi:histidine kinase [uncultured Parabacteroides sp.]|uniref:sensor histidine kinase n=1 Tax=uncultured Parabacteroides sp. TaxID=512312 RepID=UPI0026219682|nr:histidine kinase [uncultured Parabacteroides sp.]
MKKIYKWIYALIFAVSLYSCIRWVTDYTKEGHYWTKSIRGSFLEIIIIVVVSYLLFIFFENRINQNRTSRETGKWRQVWRLYGMPFLFILLCVNGTMAFSHVLLGGSLEMDAIIIANVIGSLFAFMVYNVQRVQMLDKDYAEQRIQLEKIKNDQLQTELKFLKSQYHPHFLFNALNTVYFQIDESNEAPRRTLEMISELLRYQLYGGNQKVNILQEIDYLKTYIDLRKLRMSERLRLHVEFPSGLNELKIYPLLFLPLVENAFKYVGGDYQLDIIMKRENNRISLFIRNSIPELSEEDEALCKSVDERQRKGIGLVNLRRRLSLLYPNKYHLETRKGENEFIAELMIEIEDI